MTASAAGEPLALLSLPHAVLEEKLALTTTLSFAHAFDLSAWIGGI